MSWISAEKHWSIESEMYRMRHSLVRRLIKKCDLQKDTFISYFDNWSTYFGDIPNNYDESVMQSYRLCHPHDAKAFYRMYKLQYMERDIIQSGESVWIADIGSMKDSRPIEYEYMKRNKVRSCYAVPVKMMESGWASLV